jgi:hypothetical protein
MRALSIILFVLFAPLASALAGDVDYSKIDYNKFARAERRQLAKCFNDILIVAKRHSLRENLTAFLEAGCAAEMRNYENGLAQDPPPGLEFLSKDVQKKWFSTNLIGNMEATVDGLYNDDTQMTVCSGEACVLDTYRACLYLQLSDQISKQIKPHVFENAAQQKCKSQESAARGKLIIDFITAQKQQLDGELGQKTRSLIEEVISDIRHKIVVSYSEDLIKFQPGRKSCKTEMCGDSTCIQLSDMSDAELEYHCAISD